ncbi:MAG: FIST C-terminal domain-containing protein [Comamonadaceae bacterium]|nr:FIST C-terminal domain-containing protein [Comamonadaceae bacterium]
MFKVGIAHSLTAQVDVAAASLVVQALRALDGHPPSTALLFSTYGRDHAGLLAQLVPLLLGCTIVGGSSSGEVSREQGYRVGSAVLIVFASDAIRIRAGVLRGLSFDDEAANAAAAQQQLPSGAGVAGQFGAPAPVLGLLFPDGIGLDGGSVLQLFASHFPTTRFFGGATAEDFNLKPTEQFFNTEVLHNAVPYVLFYGPLRYHWAITEGLSSGWRAVGERLDAQCNGKWITSIANKRATDYLETRYRLEGGLLSVCHPFVIYPDQGSDDHYFRDVVRYDDATGALEAVQLLPASCQVQLTQPDPEAILAASRKNILQALAHFPGTAPPAAVLWFSCVSRALVLQHDPAAEFGTATHDLPAALPVAGFYAYGEIAPAGLGAVPTFHSSTLVTLLLGEEPKAAVGLLSTQEAFSKANHGHDLQTLQDALAASRAELAVARYELAQSRELGRIAAHSKTQLNTCYRALALAPLCKVLDIQFKRMGLKGAPPRLNKTGLARLINDRHVRHWGRPFPLTVAQLARLLGSENGSEPLGTD